VAIEVLMEGPLMVVRNCVGDSSEAIGGLGDRSPLGQSVRLTEMPVRRRHACVTALRRRQETTLQNERRVKP